MSQHGSYGVHIDAQHTSLIMIDEAKAYSKAVKADDAAVPVQLWNDRITRGDVNPMSMGIALTALRKLGWKWFIRGLLRHGISFMNGKHGVDWVIRPRRAAEGLTEVGRDQTAISSLLWHSTQTDLFDY